jgi:hypothetical protein
MSDETNAVKHTPGPWVLEIQKPLALSTRIGEPIAVVGGEYLYESIEIIVGRTCDFGSHGAEQTLANARLIAAAPDMLEALEAISERFQGTFLDGFPKTKLREAIAKAKGGAE